MYDIICLPHIPIISTLEITGDEGIMHAYLKSSIYYIVAKWSWSCLSTGVIRKFTLTCDYVHFYVFHVHIVFRPLKITFSELPL